MNRTNPCHEAISDPVVISNVRLTHRILTILRSLIGLQGSCTLTCMCSYLGGGYRVLHQTRGKAQRRLQEGKGESERETIGHGLCHLP